MRFNWLSYRTAIQTHLSLFPESDMDNKKPGKSLLKAWRLNKKMKRELVADDEFQDDVKKIKTE